MKKLFVLLFVLMFALAMVACTPTEEPPVVDDPPADVEDPVEPAQQPVQTQNLTMATGGTTGTYYSFGGTLASVLNNANVGLNITVNSTGASGENVKLIGNQEVQLAIVQNDVLDYSFNGTNTWEGQDPVTNTAVVASLYPEVCQIIALKSANINSVADLKGKRVSTGDIGSGVETNSRQIMEAYGLTFDDVTQQHLGFADSAEAIQNGSLDAVFITAGIPNTSVLELATSKDLVVVPVDGAEAEQLMKDYPFYAVVEITPDVYSFMAAPVKTLAVQATLICPADLSEDVVYNLTKALFDNAAAIAAGHDKGSYLSTDYAVQGVSIDFHPGAQKYYKEVGAL